jgi:hypothetical protein
MRLTNLAYEGFAYVAREDKIYAITRQKER